MFLFSYVIEYFLYFIEYIRVQTIKIPFSPYNHNQTSSPYDWLPTVGNNVDREYENFRRISEAYIQNDLINSGTRLAFSLLNHHIFCQCIRCREEMEMDIKEPHVCSSNEDCCAWQTVGTYRPDETLVFNREYIHDRQTSEKSRKRRNRSKKLKC